MLLVAKVKTDADKPAQAQNVDTTSKSGLFYVAHRMASLRTAALWPLIMDSSLEGFWNSTCYSARQDETAGTSHFSALCCAGSQANHHDHLLWRHSRTPCLALLQAQSRAVWRSRINHLLLFDPEHLWIQLYTWAQEIKADMLEPSKLSETKRDRRCRDVMSRVMSMASVITHKSKPSNAPGLLIACIVLLAMPSLDDASTLLLEAERHIDEEAEVRKEGFGFGV